MMTAIDFLNNIAQTPEEVWNGINQATIDSDWLCINRLYDIYEQKALPFTDEYIKLKDVRISDVSDALINSNKVYSDFLELFFRDCHRPQNYKGQYYKINLDGEHEEYYLCYDRINSLRQTATCKVVRCNNVLTWQDADGAINKMPCYLGTDITSTNNQVSKKITIPNVRMIIFVQANEKTLKICDNQRFMFEHGSCFKVEEVNNYMHEQGTDGQVTFVKIYINYTPLLPTDNTELNLCDYIDVQQDDESFVQPIDVTYIKKNRYQDFICDTNTVTYEVNGVDSKYYNITTIDNGYRVECKEISNTPMVLTFKSDGKEDIVFNIELRGAV